MKHSSFFMHSFLGQCPWTSFKMWKKLHEATFSLLTNKKFEKVTGRSVQLFADSCVLNLTCTRLTNINSASWVDSGLMLTGVGVIEGDVCVTQCEPGSDWLMVVVLWGMICVGGVKEQNLKPQRKKEGAEPPESVCGYYFVGVQLSPSLVICM